MRCTICGIWKEHPAHELTLSEIETILTDPLFKNIEFVNINGGEPNLRNDIFDIVTIIIKICKKIRTITINTNGTPYDKAIKNTEGIAYICNKKNISFSVSVSLHDTDTNLYRITGIKDSYPIIMETLHALQELQKKTRFYLSINCVINALNANNIQKMRKWSTQNNIPVNFTLGEVRDRFNNINMHDIVKVSETDRQNVITFFKHLASFRSLTNHHAYRYNLLADMLEHNANRTISCHYAMCGVILGSDGNIYYCKSSKSLGNALDKSAFSIYYDKTNLEYRKSELINNKCKICPPNTFNKIEFEKDLFWYLHFLMNAIMCKTKTNLLQLNSNNQGG
jgi:MoaA/NifB/PqqE/SkfB family radical SAM enzyme